MNRGALLAALRRVGIDKGSTLFVHSSYDRIETFEGGPKEIINALLDAVGEEGTLLMPAFPMTGLSKKYLDRNPLFDPRKTPSKMGLITEVFRRWPGVERSIHPTHSVLAKGPLAKYLTSDHENALTPFGKGSPFHKLIELNGYVLLLGVGIGVASISHVGDEMLRSILPIPVYLDQPMSARIVDSHGNVRELSTFVHAPETSRIRDVELIEPYLKRANLVKSTRIGLVDIKLINAKAFLEEVVALGRKGITFFRDVKVHLGEG